MSTAFARVIDTARVAATAGRAAHYCAASISDHRSRLVSMLVIIHACHKGRSEHQERYDDKLLHEILQSR